MLSYDSWDLSIDYNYHFFTLTETPVLMAMEMDRIGSRPVGSNHDNVCPATTSGMDYLRNPRLFKGMGFHLDERQALGIHGLLPPRVKSQAEQTDNW